MLRVADSWAYWHGALVRGGAALGPIKPRDALCFSFQSTTNAFIRSLPECIQSLHPKQRQKEQKQRLAARMKRLLDLYSGGQVVDGGGIRLEVLGLDLVLGFALAASPENNAYWTVGILGEDLGHPDSHPPTLSPPCKSLLEAKLRDLFRNRFSPPEFAPFLHALQQYLWDLALEMHSAALAPLFPSVKVLSGDMNSRECTFALDWGFEWKVPEVRLDMLSSEFTMNVWRGWRLYLLSAIDACLRVHFSDAFCAMNESVWRESRFGISVACHSSKCVISGNGIEATVEINAFSSREQFLAQLRTTIEATLDEAAWLSSEDSSESKVDIIGYENCRKRITLHPACFIAIFRNRPMQLLLTTANYCDNGQRVRVIRSKTLFASLQADPSIGELAEFVLHSELSLRQLAFTPVIVENSQENGIVNSDGGDADGCSVFLHVSRLSLARSVTLAHHFSRGKRVFTFGAQIHLHESAGALVHHWRRHSTSSLDGVLAWLARCLTLLALHQQALLAGTPSVLTFTTEGADGGVCELEVQGQRIITSGDNGIGCTLGHLPNLYSLLSK